MGINLIDKIVPKNDGFLGMVDANQVIGTSGGVYTSYLPSSCISGNSISEYYLKVSNTPSDGYYLQYKDSTDELTWAEVIGGSDVAWSGASEFYAFSSNTKENIESLFNASSSLDGRIDTLEGYEQFNHDNYIISSIATGRFADSSNIIIKFPASTNIYNREWIDTYSSNVDARLDSLEGNDVFDHDLYIISANLYNRDWVDTFSSNIDSRIDSLESDTFNHELYIVSSVATERFADSSNYSSHKSDTTIHFTYESILDDFYPSTLGKGVSSQLLPIYTWFSESSSKLGELAKSGGAYWDAWKWYDTSSNQFSNWLSSGEKLSRWFIESSSKLGDIGASGEKWSRAYQSGQKSIPDAILSNGLVKKTDAFSYTAITDNSVQWDAISSSGSKYTNVYDWWNASSNQFSNLLASAQTYTTITISGSKYSLAYLSGQKVKDLFNHDLYIASSTALEIFANSSNISTRFVESGGTKWVDLTDGGETTLHTHAGISGGPNYWSSQSEISAGSIYYDAGPVVIAHSGTIFESYRLQVSGGSYFSGEVLFIGQLSGVALPDYPSSAINLTYLNAYSSNITSRYADSSNIDFRFPASSTAIEKFLASSSFKRLSFDSSLWHNSSLVWDNDISSWKAKKSGATSAGTPGGNDTEVQFNDGGSFGGDTTFTWDKTSNYLTVNGAISSQMLSGQLLSLHSSRDISGWDSNDWNNSSLTWDSTLGVWKALKSGSTAGGGTPGGDDSQIQFNDGGAFGGSSKLTFDDTTGLTSISGNVNISGNLQVLCSGITLGNTQTTACINLNIDNSGRYSSQLMLFKNNGYGGNYLPCLALKEPSRLVSYYGGGYGPAFLVNRTQEKAYAGCTAFQSWIQAKNENPSELYSFWGGVYDTGSDAVDIDYAAIGIMCYNTFAATNSRTIARIEGGHFTTEINSNVTSTDIVGGNFAATEGGGLPTVTNTIGVNINDTGGAAATNDYGIKIARIYRGTSKNYAIHTAGGEVALARDNAKLIFGTGLDATIYYNGTDLFINSKEVGTGVTYISSTAMTNILKLQPVIRSNPSPVIGEVWASGTTTKCVGIYYCTGTKWLKMAFTP